MRKLRTVPKIEMLVSCPVGYDYSGKYMEYECAKIIDVYKNKEKGYKVARVKIWFHSTGEFLIKSVKAEYLCELQPYHCLNEKIMFETALKLEGIQKISSTLEYHRLNNRCKDEGYINSVCW